MKKVFHLTLFVMAVALAACMATPAPSESETKQAVETAAPAGQTAAPGQTAPGKLPPGVKILRKGESPPVSQFASFCFNIYGPCNFGQCEEPAEDYQDLTEICCYGGSCVNEYYRQCGGCNAESSGPCTVF